MNLDIYLQDTIKLIQSFVQINSIRDENTKTATQPFGQGVDRCFDHFIDISKQMGMRTYKDPQGYYAYSEIGPQDGELIGILAHLDTVKIGDERQWTKAAPFSGAIVDEQIIGRGSLDDKGPLCVNLMALYALIKANYQFNHRIRVIVGGAEETTWEGIEAYKQHEDIPQFGYTPDADFPLIHGEQAIVQVKISGVGDERITCHTTNSINAVCDHLELNVNGEIYEYNGTSAHAMECYKGHNAINDAFSDDLLADNALFPLVHNHLLDQHARNLFPNINDDTMTLNIGNLYIDSNCSYVELDMRFPLTTDVESYLNQLKTLCGEYNLTLEVLKLQEEIYLEPDHSLVTTLLHAYNQTMNEDAQPLTTGGGTYARALDNFVAFGMVFTTHGMLDKMHQPNECLEIKYIIPALHIYFQAIQELDHLSL